MHPSLARLDHRPWPLPEGRWRWRQQWDDLAFVHWEIDPAALEKLLPEGLEPDLHDGRGWIGVVPFEMRDVSPRGLPRFPPMSDFPEINIRTYVTRGGKPGVWFISLDASNPVAVKAARALFHLPYHRAGFTIRRQGEALRYRSERKTQKTNPPGSSTPPTPRPASPSPPAPAPSNTGPPNDTASMPPTPRTAFTAPKSTTSPGRSSPPKSPSAKTPLPPSSPLESNILASFFHAISMSWSGTSSPPEQNRRTHCTTIFSTTNGTPINTNDFGFSKELREMHLLSWSVIAGNHRTTIPHAPGRDGSPSRPRSGIAALNHQKPPAVTKHPPPGSPPLARPEKKFKNR